MSVFSVAVDRPADIVRVAMIVLGFFAIGWATVTIAHTRSEFALPRLGQLLFAASYACYQLASIVYIYRRFGEPLGVPSLLVLAGAAACIACAAYLAWYYRPKRREARHRARNDRTARDLLRLAERRKKGEA